MIKSKKEPKTQQYHRNLGKEHSSWNKIVDAIPNNTQHPKNIILTPSSLVSSITINSPYLTKHKNQNKVDTFLQTMKTRTIPNKN